MKNWEELKKFVNKVISEENIAGASIAISKDGKVIFEQGFGYRDLEKELPVTPDTVMGIASISKSFTALEIMKLVDEGVLKTTDLVTKHLPGLKIAGIDMDKLQIKHLLSHTSGLPPVGRRQDHIHFKKHIEYLNGYETELLGEPGDYFSYANDVFLLLGAILEKYRKCTYARHMTSLLNTLDMKNSTLYVDEIEKLSEVTKNYIYNEVKKEYELADWPRLGVYEAGGGVRSSVRDLLKYGSVYVNDVDNNYVSKESIEEMYTPVYETNPGEYYCYALKATPNYHGVTLVEHGGGQPGVSSNFGFVPEENLVVAVLTNTSGKPASVIWRAAVNCALGLPLLEEKEVEPYEMSNQEIDNIVGYYETDEGGDLLIYKDKDNLRGVSANKHYTYTPLSHDTLLVNEMTYQTKIRFMFKKEERAWAVFVGSRIFPRKI